MKSLIAKSLMFSLRSAGVAVAVSLFAVPSAMADGGPLTVKRQSIEDRKAVYATVESADTLVARARIGGTVGGLTVDEGDSVEAEEIIAVVGDHVS